MKFWKSKNESTKTLISNFSYLSLLEIIGILFPMLTYPYLIRVLGKDLYGVIVFSQAILAYVIIITNFGFNVSATRRISEYRHDSNMVKKIFSSIIYLKSVICVLCLLIYFALLLIFDFQYKIVYFYIIGLCVQEVLFPVWFFQGMEKMRYITIVSFISRFLFVLLIFFIVKKQADYWVVPLAYSLGGSFSSIISLIIIKRKFKIFFVKVNRQRLWLDFKESYPFFTSRLASVVMERTNVLLIGAFFDFGTVAVYDLCVKVVSIFKMPFTLISQVLYPHVARTKNMMMVHTVYKKVLLLGIILAILVCLFSPIIVKILAGDGVWQAVSLLRIMGWYLPIVGASYILGASTLVITGYVREYNLSVLYAFMMYSVLIVFLLYFDWVNIYTMAITYILPELYIALYRRYIAFKNGLLK